MADENMKRENLEQMLSNFMKENGKPASFRIFKDGTGVNLRREEIKTVTGMCWTDFITYVAQRMLDAEEKTAVSQELPVGDVATGQEYQSGVVPHDFSYEVTGVNSRPEILAAGMMKPEAELHTQPRGSTAQMFISALARVEEENTAHYNLGEEVSASLDSALAAAQPVADLDRIVDSSNQKQEGEPAAEQEFEPQYSGKTNKGFPLPIEPAAPAEPVQPAETRTNRQTLAGYPIDYRQPASIASDTEATTPYHNPLSAEMPLPEQGESIPEDDGLVESKPELPREQTVFAIVQDGDRVVKSAISTQGLEEVQGQQAEQPRIGTIERMFQVEEGKRNGSDDSDTVSEWANSESSWAGQMPRPSGFPAMPQAEPKVRDDNSVMRSLEELRVVEQARVSGEPIADTISAQKAELSLKAYDPAPTKPALSPAEILAQALASRQASQLPSDLPPGPDPLDHVLGEMEQREEQKRLTQGEQITPTGEIAVENTAIVRKTKNGYSLVTNGDGKKVMVPAAESSAELPPVKTMIVQPLPAPTQTEKDAYGTDRNVEVITLSSDRKQPEKKKGLFASLFGGKSQDEKLEAKVDKAEVPKKRGLSGGIIGTLIASAAIAGAIGLASYISGGSKPTKPESMQTAVSAPVQFDAGYTHASMAPGFPAVAAASAPDAAVPVIETEAPASQPVVAQAPQPGEQPTQQPKVETQDVKCNPYTRIQFKFASDRPIDQGALEDTLTEVLQRAKESGAKKVKVYAFASIENKSDGPVAKNNDAPSNMSLAGTRGSAVISAATRVDKKIKSGVTEYELVNYGETEAFGPNLEDNRTVVVMVGDLQDPDKTQEGRELAKKIDPHTVKCSSQSDSIQGSIDLDTIPGAGKATKHASVEVSPDLEESVMFGSDLEEEISAAGLPVETFRNECTDRMALKNKVEVSPQAVCQDYTSAQLVVLDNIYSQVSSGNGSLEEYGDLAEVYGIKSFTMEDAKRAHDKLHPEDDFEITVVEPEDDFEITVDEPQVDTDSIEDLTALAELDDSLDITEDMIVEEQVGEDENYLEYKLTQNQGMSDIWDGDCRDKYTAVQLTALDHIYKEYLAGADIENLRKVADDYNIRDFSIVKAEEAYNLLSGNASGVNDSSAVTPINNGSLSTDNKASYSSMPVSKIRDDMTEEETFAAIADICDEICGLPVEGESRKAA